MKCSCSLLIIFIVVFSACKKSKLSFTPDLSNLSKQRKWHMYHNSSAHYMGHPSFDTTYRFDTSFALSVAGDRSVNGLRYDSVNSKKDVYYFGVAYEHYYHDHYDPLGGSIVYFTKIDSVAYIYRESDPYHYYYQSFITY
ncbi:MAG: hypothetical protein JWQ38_3425 [Flavipsychrobacter sp.]|nr:hypothetical protein [Flavipsychrobacter sp.]